MKRIDGTNLASTTGLFAEILKHVASKREPIIDEIPGQVDIEKEQEIEISLTRGTFKVADIQSIAEALPKYDFSLFEDVRSTRWLLQVKPRRIRPNPAR